jgi:hypothetical protein
VAGPTEVKSPAAQTRPIVRSFRPFGKRGEWGAAGLSVEVRGRRGEERIRAAKLVGALAVFARLGRYVAETGGTFRSC